LGGLLRSKGKGFAKIIIGWTCNGLSYASNTVNSK